MQIVDFSQTFRRPDIFPLSAVVLGILDQNKMRQITFKVKVCINIMLRTK